jgi:hypothetical protein
MKSISPERQPIAKIFKTHIGKAVLELGAGYSVTLQGKFDETPIRIERGIAFLFLPSQD